MPEPQKQEQPQAQKQEQPQTPPAGKHFVVLHHTLGWSGWQADEQGNPVKTPDGKPVPALHTFQRGDVVPAARFTTMDTERLLRLGAVREATAAEVQHPRVQLPEGGELSPSAEALLRTKEVQLGQLHEELARVAGELAAAKQQVAVPAQPGPQDQAPQLQALLQEKDSQIERQQRELQAIRGHLEQLQQAQAQMQAQLQVHTQVQPMSRPVPQPAAPAPAPATPQPAQSAPPAAGEEEPGRRPGRRPS